MSTNKDEINNLDMCQISTVDSGDQHSEYSYKIITNENISDEMWQQTNFWMRLRIQINVIKTPARVIF